MEFSRQAYWGGLPFPSPKISEEEIGKLPEKEFRIMIVKMIKKNLENRMEKMQVSI